HPGTAVTGGGGESRAWRGRLPSIVGTVPGPASWARFVSRRAQHHPWTGTSHSRVSVIVRNTGVRSPVPCPNCWRYDVRGTATRLPARCGGRPIIWKAESSDV